MVAIVVARGLRLAVVEDSLADNGWRVVSVGTTVEAIEQFHAHHPDVGLVVVDGCEHMQDEPALFVSAVRSSGYKGLVAGVACHDDHWKELTLAGYHHVLSGEVLLAHNLALLARDAMTRM